MIEEAQRLLSAIKAKSPKGANGLYCQRISKAPEVEHTYSNALVGVLAAMTSDRDEAERLYKSLREKIKKGPHKLYRDRVELKAGEPGNPAQAQQATGTMQQQQQPTQTTLTGQPAAEPEKILHNEFTDANAAMGIFAFCMGDVKEARFQLKRIMNNIPSGEQTHTGLFGHGAESKNEYADATAGVGILAALLGETRIANQLYWLIDEKVPRSSDGLFGERSGKTEENADTNALIGVLAYLIGYEDEAKRQYALIQAHIPRGDNGMYGNSVYSVRERIDSSAAVGILAAVVGGLKISKS